MTGGATQHAINGIHGINVDLNPGHRLIDLFENMCRNGHPVHAMLFTERDAPKLIIVQTCDGMQTAPVSCHIDSGSPVKQPGHHPVRIAAQHNGGETSYMLTPFEGVWPPTCEIPKD